MRKAKIILGVAVLSVLFLVMVTESMAAWYVVSVEFAGKNDDDGNVYFRVTHTAAVPLFTFQMVKAPLASQDQYLAIGLTAQVTGTNVGICATIPPGANQNTPYALTCMHLQ